MKSAFSGLRHRTVLHRHSRLFSRVFKARSTHCVRYESPHKSGRRFLIMKRENLELPQGTSLRGQNACNCEHFFLIRIASLAFIFWLATAIGSFGQSFATVHSFIGDPSEGSEVYAPVIQATDGSLYGI